MQDPLKPDTIIEYINSLPLERFRRLFSLISDIENEINFGSINIGTINDITFYGGFTESSVVSSFISYCYDLNLVINFPASTWKEGADFLKQGCPDIHCKDLLFIIQAITYSIRQDKFVDGSLIGLFKNGAILTLLKRLKVLVENPVMLEKYNWGNLKSSQLGRYAEYFAKMEFTQYGFDVYTSEVDDKGIDFIISKNNKYYEIQVKSVLKSQYVFMPKSKFELKHNLYLALVLFTQDNLPEIYLIPSQSWIIPNSLLVDRNYSELHKSKPEYGIQLSVKSRELLKGYKFENILISL